MGIAAVNLTQLAPKAVVLCDLKRVTTVPFKVIQGHLFRYDRKPVCCITLVAYILRRTVSELSERIGQIIAFDRGAYTNILTPSFGGEFLNSGL